MNKLIPLTLAALGLATPASAQIPSFQHIILVIQENRTPDNLFQGLCTQQQTRARAAPSRGPGSTISRPRGGWIRPRPPARPIRTPTRSASAMILRIVTSAFVAMCDLKNGACAMDGAAQGGVHANAQPCPAKAAYGYVDNSTGAVQPYLDIVQSYGWANYMFQTNQGPSYPAHQFLFGATSAPSAHDDHHGIFVAANAGRAAYWMCAAPTATAALINPKGVEFTRIFPCFEHRTLSDLLERAAVTWRYYGVGGDILDDHGAQRHLDRAESIEHICNRGPIGQCTGTEWTSQLRVRAINQF